MLLVASAGCAANEAASRPSIHRSTVQKAQYLAIKLGTRQQTVKDEFGPPSEDSTMTAGSQVEDCWSYLNISATYIFCFDENGVLIDKSESPTVAGAP